MAVLFLFHERALAGSLLLVFIAACLLRVLYNLFFHPLRSYPGPVIARASRLYYAYYLNQGTLSEKIRKLHEKYGNCVRIAPDELSYTNAEAWQEICGRASGKSQDFEKDRTFYPIAPNGIDSIITARWDVHHRFRRLLSHPLSEKALAAQEEIIMSYVDQFIEGLKNESKSAKTNGVVEMVRWFTFISWDILGDLAFGEPFGCLKTHKLHSWITLIHTAVKSALNLQTMQRFIPGLFGMVMGLMSILGSAMAQNPMDNFMFCARKARERLGKDLDRPDFMTYILQANDENGMSQEEIESNSQVLIDAGTETVATALSGIFYYLIRNPRCHHLLEAEVRSQFHGSHEITILSTQRLPYLKAVIEEGMRMHPPAPGTFPRTTPPGGAMICGKFVPGGYSVGVNQCAVTRSPENFLAPDEFAPERWMGDERFSEDRKAAFQPFSYGPRNCIGKNLAYAEMRLVLTKMLWHFDIELQEDSMNWAQGQKTNMYWEMGDMNVQLKEVVR